MSSFDKKSNQSKNSEDAQHEKLLPWLVNGTLKVGEKKSLKKAIVHSDKLQLEIEFLTHLQQQVKQQKFPDVPMEFAWQKLKKQIESEKKEAASVKMQSTPAQSTSRWRLTAIAASALLIIQSASIMIPDSINSEYIPLSSEYPETSSGVHLLIVRFVGTATINQIQGLLKQHQLSIISGPSASGLYRISTDKNISEIIKVLESSPKIIAYAQAEE